MATLFSLGAITIDGYRVHTGDTTTAATIVSGALVEAEEILEDELRRKLALQARTDAFRIYPDGRLYPDAYPIVTSTMTIDGRALLGATFDLATWVGFFPDSTPNLATVTWTGGYDDGTNSARLPATLRHAIYDLGRALAIDAAPIPVGAVSVSVGDVSVTYARPSEGGLDAFVPGLWDRVKRYRNRLV